MFFRVGRSAGMIHLDPQCGGHGPQLMVSVQENRSKDILVVSLLSAVIYRVASNFLVPVVWVRGFFKASFIM